MYLLLTSLFFTACQSKQKEDVLSLDDVSEASKAYAESMRFPTEKTIHVNYFDSLSPFSQGLVDSFNLQLNSIHLIDTMLFPDRFGATDSEKWYSKTAADSLVFVRWVFQSKVKAENALYNWLDCFGATCRSIPMGTDAKFSKKGILLLCNLNELIYVESAQKWDSDAWLKYIQGNRKEKDWKFFIIQQPNRKIEWKTINSDGEWMNYHDKFQ